MAKGGGGGATTVHLITFNPEVRVLMGDVEDPGLIPPSLAAEVKEFNRSLHQTLK